MDQQWNSDNNNVSNDNGNVTYDNSNATYDNNASYSPETVTVANDGKDSKDGLCMAGFILGIVGFFINPLYIVSILAIIFGAIGMKSTSANAGKAKIGLILGIVAICVQIVVDLLLTVLTAGIGGVSFCC